MKQCDTIKRIYHDDFVKEAMKRPGVVQELENLEDEFKIYEELMKLRLKFGKIQEE